MRLFFVGLLWILSLQICLAAPLTGTFIQEDPTRPFGHPHYRPNSDTYIISKDEVRHITYRQSHRAFKPGNTKKHRDAIAKRVVKGDVELIYLKPTKNKKHTYYTLLRCQRVDQHRLRIASLHARDDSQKVWSLAKSSKPGPLFYSQNYRKQLKKRPPLPEMTAKQLISFFRDWKKAAKTYEESAFVDTIARRKHNPFQRASSRNFLWSWSRHKAEPGVLKEVSSLPKGFRL